MERKFKKQLEILNAAALDFGTLGYHVVVSIHGAVASADLTIFYNKKSEKKKIQRILCLYQEEGDVIEHNTYPAVTSTGKPFYTWKLSKEEV